MLRSTAGYGCAGRLSLLLVALVLGAGALSARAEFAVGSEVPAFSLRTADGKTVALESIAGSLRLTHDGKSEVPRLVAIHLLQPDCLQCRAQLKGLEKLHKRYGEDGLAVLGVSHRGDGTALATLGRDLRITFPLVVGTGSELAREFAAGDTFALIDGEGIVRFAQVGYGAGDEKIWAESVEAMLAGKTPVHETVDRERLKAGDPFPAVVLPSLRNGKPMELVGKGDRLTFRDDAGRESQPKGAVGFFSRY